jgi:hypothetical protein
LSALRRPPIVFAVLAVLVSVENAVDRDIVVGRLGAAAWLVAAGRRLGPGRRLGGSLRTGSEV